MYNIRYAGIGDIPMIRELSFQVWPQTYASLLSPEQIDYMLKMMYSEASLQQQMTEGSQFITIHEDDQPVGFAAFQEIEPTIFKLHKLYVLPSQQGKGTGRYLVDHIIEEIKNKGASSLQLQVKRDNKARFFYEKNGFHILRELDLDIGNGFVMQDYIMIREL